MRSRIEYVSMVRKKGSVATLMSAGSGGLRRSSRTMREADSVVLGENGESRNLELGDLVEFQSASFVGTGRTTWLGVWRWMYFRSVDL
jgi:hypothetical protein